MLIRGAAALPTKKKWSERERERHCRKCHFGPIFGFPDCKWAAVPLIPVLWVIPRYFGIVSEFGGRQSTAKSLGARACLAIRKIGRFFLPSASPLYSFSTFSLPRSSETRSLEINDGRAKKPKRAVQSSGLLDQDRGTKCSSRRI